MNKVNNSKTGVSLNKINSDELSEICEKAGTGKTETVNAILESITYDKKLNVAVKLAVQSKYLDALEDEEIRKIVDAAIAAKTKK